MGGSEQQLNSISSTPPLPLKRHVINKPISLAGPTEVDLIRNAELGKVVLFEIYCFRVKSVVFYVI